tara:strand:- start:290 stop:481 length:192 start_codon:yes stop_codon:yes gene_type:complete
MMGVGWDGSSNGTSDTTPSLEIREDVRGTQFFFFLFLFLSAAGELALGAEFLPRESQNRERCV